MTRDMEKPKDFTTKRLDVINEVNKGSGDKVNRIRQKTSQSLLGLGEGKWEDIAQLV